jgi:Ca2+-binding EF-hand superfamily protein
LERLFDAFDQNGDKTIDLEEFINGLSVFMKGTPEEKLERKQNLKNVVCRRSMNL